MGKTSLRAGIAGAGFISDYHIAGLQGAGAEVVCVASRTLPRAQAKASQFGIGEATDDVEGMVRRSDLDLVVIATPDAPTSHWRWRLSRPAGRFSCKNRWPVPQPRPNGFGLPPSRTVFP